MPMVRLYSAEDAIEAHLLKHMLEQMQIAVYITGEHLEGAVGELPAGGNVDVWVLDQQFPDAQDVLEDFFDTLDAPDDEDGLRDGAGYYHEDGHPDDDAEDHRHNPRTDNNADDEPDTRPAHNDPANPWNGVYKKT